MRIYDKVLDCGCVISCDGGGLIPCYYEYGSKKDQKKCKKAWSEFRKSEDWKKYMVDL